MIRVTLPAEEGRVGSFLALVEQFARDLAFPPARTQKLVLVLEEALLNVVKHAYDDGDTRDMEIVCAERDGDIVIEVRDHGRTFNPLELPDPDIGKDVKNRPIGGLGIFLIRKIANEVSYRREENTNVLTMILHRQE